MHSNVRRIGLRGLLTVSRKAAFVIPRWMTLLDPPSIPFIDSPPSYKEVATAINKCKNGASACPFDQLSILILKRCPILRTLLHSIIVNCWNQKRIRRCWKRGTTILIYKKGDTSYPSNFRPITLQPVWYKIFASTIKSKMQDFLFA